ncbi:non-heme ferritin [Candidatus Palibaumannia cicadellinicola]|uniref:Ferritin n=1 Tax=Baumannia cicadellinicola subsp. Homalodisca coagulata TaxID=374463 RepID=Q1LTF7_BAUCH|nr:non-heme ferritin [Candidatus Baumannia cicadellinicola]ABF13931.1 ferritin [Baumannia cicadellinicola str. Hc (Homalodisca coagulata)]MBS0032737.1 non-heme ferritin [Candidatus Baumannia cicadellinicola]MCJ7462260.1 non-heme ferritin [Candidatus Baumannia cicadellinicola]MCJ7462522.1 non-heme ferritin [Candidatus Baumannia cicadellinicola]
MLKSEIKTKLDEQLNLEIFSVNLYLQMSSWCKNKGFEGVSSFFKKQSQEENNHIYRLFDYLNDIGTMPIVGYIKAPPIDYSSLTELIQIAYQHEQNLTQNINQLVHTAITLQDYSTFYFLQWYIAEQQKEENRFKYILDQLKLVNINYNGIFLIDQMFKTLS